jgi:putative tricarboxylic transport membrane protein
MLLVLNLPLIGIWVRLLKVPYRLLFPIIVTLMGIGIYSLNNSGTDVLLAAFFGFVGYVFVKFDCPFPPLILAMVLGPLMEENLRRSLLLTDGDPAVFFTRPISAAFMAATGALLVLFALPALRRKRREVIPQEEGTS